MTCAAPGARRSFLQAMLALWAGASSRLWGASPASDPSRVALVVGNNEYPGVPLANAANDARLMAEVLGEAGFGVDAQINATGDAMQNAVKAFGAAVARPEVKFAVFYYAGHGAQVEWRNFLLPVDAVVHNATELQKTTFDLGWVVEALPTKSRSKTFVLILDACRDNPFGGAFQPQRKGLSPFDAPVSTLIAFSTSPGSVASDGSGSNGLYTESLARELRVKGMRIEDAFKRVRANVTLASRGTQVPWESTSLVGDVYVFPPQAAPSEEELERQFEEEVAHWTRIKGSKNPADWAGLLRAFPNGKLCEIAQARLNLLLAQAGPGTSRTIAQRRSVTLGPGLPIPEFLMRSENPYSAGTYALDRHFSVGDEAVYVSRNRERFRRHVTRVDIAADRVELNDGRIVTDLLGNLLKRDNVEFEVPVQVTPAELQVGKRWSARFAAHRLRNDFNEEMQAQVVARERITVPAGGFDAFRIESTRRGIRLYGKKREMHARREDLVMWVVPGLNFPIKQELTQRGGRAGEEPGDLELESLRQKE